jgi:hypothetical protein
MKKCPYSAQREQILAEAISPVASELRLLDAADLISLLRFERYGNLGDLVASAAELYFLPGTVNFGLGGDYKLDWGGPHENTALLARSLRDARYLVRGEAAHAI